jgi:uncharacterized protein
MSIPLASRLTKTLCPRWGNSKRWGSLNQWTSLLRPRLGRSLLLLFTLALTSILAFGPTTTAQVPNERSLLWEISGKNLAKPSYLYGTIHLTCANQIQPSNTLRQKFNSTQQLYLELDMDDPNTSMALLNQMRLPQGKTLRSYLKPKDYNTVAQFFQENIGLPLENMHSLKPFFLISLLYPPLMACPIASWEDTLSKLAQARNIPLQGLETVQEQVAAIDRVPIAVQLQSLMMLVRNPGAARKEIQGLMALYRTQDITRMANMGNSDPATKRYDQALLGDRNRRWIPRMARIAKAKPTFFAVGAGHLGGKDGVIALLRRSGYRVRSIALK